MANAPVSDGAFEQTVGVLPNAPDAEVVLDAIATAGHDGTELGPYGYFGTERALHAAVERRGWSRPARSSRSTSGTAT